MPIAHLGGRAAAQTHRNVSGADRKTNATAYVIETNQVEAGAPLSVDLAPGGGVAVRFASTE